MLGDDTNATQYNEQYKNNRMTSDWASDKSSIKIFNEIMKRRIKGKKNKWHNVKCVWEKERKERYKPATPVNKLKQQQIQSLCKKKQNERKK